MQDLFSNQTPLLSEQLRPKQSEDLVGPVLRIWKRDIKQWLEVKPFHFTLWGPPGVGKTTLARLLAEASGRLSVQLSAVRDGVKELRDAAEKYHGGLVFIDEIHRLNRAQQDVLLPIMEDSKVWIVGATTENPSVSLNPAILSRMRTIYAAPPATEDTLQALLRGLDSFGLNKEQDEKRSALLALCKNSIAPQAKGDIRHALNLLEALFYAESESDRKDVLLNNSRPFAKKEHYDWVSAMIKSMRGSDPDASLFYAFAAIENGEDPIFIMRRCIIFASEDVGNADPQAITLAMSCFDSVKSVGLPEALYPLAQCITYLASTDKSNRTYVALQTVREWTKKYPQFEPRFELTKAGSQKYQYPHDYPNSFVACEYLPPEIAAERNHSGRAYIPSEFGGERRLKQRLDYFGDLKRQKE